MKTAPSFPVRNFKFPVGAKIARHWHGGRKSVTNFFDGLSVLFPEGERMFVEAVKAHREFAKDPQLEADVRAFCAQEGIHAREHERYNDMLREKGYPIDRMEQLVKERIERGRRLLTPRQRLAVTAALEHFTALMARISLHDPRAFEGADPTMAALWRWHAVEESEHKSVAFDVYKAAGGTYVERTRVMAIVTVIFWARIFENQVRMMHTDGIALSPREWYELVHFLFVDPGGMGGVVRLYFEYFRPDFHPSQVDNDEVVHAWQRELSISPAYPNAAL
jgi:predicted metal-dependent hydrolase